MLMSVLRSGNMLPDQATVAFGSVLTGALADKELAGADLDVF